MKARTPLHVTATGTRIMASKGKVAFLTAAVARYGRRRRAHARFLRPSPAFAHVRSRSTAVDGRNVQVTSRVTYISFTLRPLLKN